MAGGASAGSGGAAAAARRPVLLWNDTTVVTDMRTYDSIDCIADAVKSDAFSTSTPFLVKAYPTLDAAVASARCKTAVATFRTQLPSSKQAKANQKAQGPLPAPLQAELSPLLSEVVPGNIRMEPAASVVLWGALKNMVCSGFEHQSLGSVRYMAEGTREMLVISYEHAWQWVEAVIKAENPDTYDGVSVDAEMSPMAHMSGFFLDGFSEAAINVVKEVGGTMWRVTQTKGGWSSDSTTQSRLYGFDDTCVKPYPLDAT